MIVSKRNTPICKLLIGDATIKQVQKFEYVGNALAENGSGDSLIQNWTNKRTLPKVNQILKIKKVSLETRKRAQNCHVLTVHLYGCGCWIISLQTTKYK